MRAGDQQFVKDRAKLREETELRLAILEAIKTRLDNRNRSINQIFGKGSWSDFDYDFSNAHFFYPVNFINRYFGASLNFSGATFAQEADFSGVTFTQADFSGAAFTRNANFSEAIFERLPIFRKTGGFTLLNPANFSCKGHYNFEVSPDSPYKIDTEDHRSPDGTITTIPKGCIVFDSKTGEEVPHTPAPNGSV